MITLHYQRKLEGFLIEKISSEMLKDWLQKVGFVGLSVIFRRVWRIGMDVRDSRALDFVHVCTEA